MSHLYKQDFHSDKALNKREAKSGGYWNDYQDRKAIESDLIRIFSSRATGRSFAFGFYYSDLEKPYIMVSFKKNQSFINFNFSLHG